MNICANINSRIAADLQRITASKSLNTVEVVAHWREYETPDGLPLPDPDPLMVSSHIAAQFVEKSYTFAALVHYVDHTTSSYSAHKEVATGDVILDYAEQTNFQEKSNIRFLINGNYYIPKKIGKGLQDSWDVSQVTRTLLLTLQP